MIHVTSSAKIMDSIVQQFVDALHLDCFSSKHMECLPRAIVFARLIISILAHFCSFIVIYLEFLFLIILLLFQIVSKNRKVNKRQK